MNSKCVICKNSSNIQCDQCNAYVCSKGHLYLHKQRSHRAISANTNLRYNPNRQMNINKTQQIDYQKLNEHLNSLKMNVIKKMNNQEYLDAIEIMKNALDTARKYYREDNAYIIELLYSQAECYLNLSNLDESKSNLETILYLTDNNVNQSENLIFRHKANMLLGAICINLGQYNTSLKCYTSCENELPKLFKEPELNVKLSAVYLNMSLCYIYLGNKNIAEKYLKKGLNLTEGILGNEAIHKLNADLYENLGVVNEQMNKFKESLIYYKKSLKLKFNIYGETYDEVLELQYKISSIYLSLKQYQQAEEILSSVNDLILKEKINYATQETIYRYSVYFYTYGVVLIKLNRLNNAKFYLNKSLEILNDFLMPNDSFVLNIKNLLKICDINK